MLKSWIHLDQSYFPERLHQLYIVNTPWYFSSLLGMFQPFIDKKTRKKIEVFQGDFLSALTEHIDIDTIPEELGGSCAEADFCSPRSELTGVSQLQIQAYVEQEFFNPESTRVMTAEEDTAVRAIQSHAARASRQERLSDMQASIYYSAGVPSSLSTAVSSPGGGGGGNRNSDISIEMTYMSSVFEVSITEVEVSALSCLSLHCSSQEQLPKVNNTHTH
jgi:hypothetical protein